MRSIVIAFLLLALAGCGDTTSSTEAPASTDAGDTSTGEVLDTPSFDEQYDVLVEHYTAMLDHYGEGVGTKIARKHLGWYTKGLHGSADFRNFVNFIDDPRKVLEEIERFYEPFLRRRAA